MKEYNGSWLGGPTQNFEAKCKDLVNSLETFKRDDIFCRVIGNDLRDEQVA